MIKSIEVKNFKCFREHKFQLKNLNILSGINGTGKSTFIQSILLQMQSLDYKGKAQFLNLNGQYINMGIGKDAYCDHADAKNPRIKFVFEYDDERICYTYRVTPNSSYLPLESYKGDMSTFNDRIKKIEYINAMRISPENAYPKSDHKIQEERQVGISGEYAASYLYSNGHEKVANQKVLLEDEVEDDVKHQVMAWYNKVIPNTQFNIDEHANPEFMSIKYGFKTGDDEASRYYRPSNVGFGLTYVLPVILSLVKAKKGDIVIIENPEAHLHPKGQSMIGRLMVRAAAGGAQIITETHSDHVLNGVRLGIKKEFIHHQDVKVFFFDKKRVGQTIKHIVETPEILEDGRLSFWPDGFFDEWDKAMWELF